MATSSIKNIESESSTARKDSLEQIRQAFDINGVEFTPGTEVLVTPDIDASLDEQRLKAAFQVDIAMHHQRIGVD